ncbi:hypothetical protein BKH14_01135 [Actinomyces naeslundii]|nr:hypothetical protein BKH14_01135 [Actinomyces naeslundii]
MILILLAKSLLCTILCLRVLFLQSVFSIFLIAGGRAGMQYARVMMASLLFLILELVRVALMLCWYVRVDC